MTEQELKQTLDRLQFEQSQQAERLTKLEAVAPPLPNEFMARLDHLVATMNEFRESAMKVLIDMAATHKPLTPVAATPATPEPTAIETPFPDISVGWHGGERRG